MSEQTIVTVPVGIGKVALGLTGYTLDSPGIPDQCIGIEIDALKEVVEIGEDVPVEIIDRDIPKIVVLAMNKDAAVRLAYLASKMVEWWSDKEGEG